MKLLHSFRLLSSSYAGTQQHPQSTPTGCDMTRLPTRRLLALALAAGLSLPAAAALAAEPFVASDIRVDGLQRIASGTVFTYLPVNRGDTVDDGKVADSIRALYRTGFFEDVQLDRQGNILVITVKERPAINKLTVTGNKDIKSEELLKGLGDIGLTEGGTFDRLSLDRVTQELTRQYNNRGKYNVEITPTVSPLDRNRVDVAIAIKEGKAAKIRHVNLIGTEKFANEDILENWESKEHNWASWYRRDDQYSKEKMSGDLEKLNSWYLDRGYVDFSVDSTQVSISPDKRDMFVSAGVTEGEQYKISEIKVTGDTVLPQADIERLVIPKAGDIFSRALLEYTSDAITNTLSNVGYAFAKVNPIPTPNREDRTVAVNLQVVPGPRVSVRRILYKGNSRTSDEVLRREMRQFENTWYSQAAIDRSKIRLQRLGYFESVDVETPAVPGSNDQVDVVYNVKETTSGSFVFGLGFSQAFGVTTSVQLSQNNFLGGGNRVAVEASRSTFQQRYAFSYTNPFFTDDGVSLGYNLSWRELDYSDFNTAQFNSTNGSAQVVFGVPITENDTVSAMIGVDSNQITTFPGTTPQAIVDYIQAIGTDTFKAVRTEFGWARDTRNDFFMPTRGMYQRVGLETTLPGSTVEYYKLNYQISNYWPIIPAIVLNTRFELGYGDSYGKDSSGVITNADGTTRPVTATGLPFYENFYAGGTNSVRGFEDNTLGPRSEAINGFNRGQPLGGSLKTVGSVEMYFPKLFDSPSARISAFFDFGNVYSDVDAFKANELRASTGVALLWRAPVGPISISYAFPLKKEDNDEIERLQFTFGGQF
ncbi:outer membrane protein assembly factor BamA [Xanthomonas campestris pv. raphani]|mgnify:CR=1 FL=1|jgi:outer membrane protein insertion porin family|uniref:Outer membrane protein assembly factor BamA n=6 Tax=Gammaproteobacteria TaxID=1236 RepID=Q8PAW1_XANCP|nr:outer membrane antigen [Xanthomonas campestris pv. campestris str. ATCC 33913]AAY49921.1 outer membrane antigen [Xanthomonas campestris pv. campestris str. 8004]QCX67641.1 outer membrane protein assembly factor BamA [Xanthomonas campestris pv. campestris]RFF43387.1 outer membrane protein assembly factor BamA [Xanthomonas campestris pv. incanae]RFF48398.1 outer membrane protein assembly factor BamA [Xanthomonas campestris]